eukprot:COSAG02_NODE_2046_length_10017_cov_3.000403_7_plen_138_part_00
MSLESTLIRALVDCGLIFGRYRYDQKVMFLSFNVTQLLRPGPNAVGARLGNSKFGYLDIYTNRTALGDQSGDASRAFRLVLVATLSDGSEHTLASAADGSWHMRHGPIVYDHLWQVRPRPSSMQHKYMNSLHAHSQL